MPRYLISYDLKSSEPSPHRPLLDAAEGQDLLYVLHATELYRLPNTTLWGIFADKKAARDAFERAIADAERVIGRKITLEKRVITGFRDFFVRSDKRKKPDSRWLGTSDFETCREHQLNDPFFR